MTDWNRDDTFLARWLSDELNAEELKAFEQSSDFSHYQRIRETLSNAKSLEFDTEAELRRLKENRRSAQPRVRKLSSLARWSIAASIFLVSSLGLLYLWQKEMGKPVVAYTEAVNKTKVELPGGSVVKLNSSSSLAYSKEEWSSERSLDLSGEAYFEVEKGNTFTVHTEAGTVAVLGTRFNVKLRKGVLDVLCYHGKVQVVSETVVQELTEGMGIRIAEGRSRSLIVESKEPSWVSGIISLQDVPLSEALDELERQFDCTVIGNHADFNGIYNGDFPTDDFEAAVALVLAAFENELEYTVDNEKREITLKPLR